MKPRNDTVNMSDIVKQLAEHTPKNGLEIRELIERIGEQGLLAAVMLLTVPFLLPVSIPGTSTPFGLLIILICTSIITSGPLLLPNRLNRMRIKHKHMIMIANHASKLFRKLEAWSKPRLLMLTSKEFKNAHLISMMLNSVCMMLPLPLPLSNAIPAYGIVFLALGLVRRDGALVICGYLMLITILTYLAAVYTMGTIGVKSLLW